MGRSFKKNVRSRSPSPKKNEAFRGPLAQLVVVRRANATPRDMWKVSGRELNFSLFGGHLTEQDPNISKVMLQKSCSFVDLACWSVATVRQA